MHCSIIVTLNCDNECEIPGKPEIRVTLMCILMLCIAACMK